MHRRGDQRDRLRLLVHHQSPPCPQGTRLRVRVRQRDTPRSGRQRRGIEGRQAREGRPSVAQNQAPDVHPERRAVGQQRRGHPLSPTASLRRAIAQIRRSTHTPLLLAHPSA